MDQATEVEDTARRRYVSTRISQNRLINRIAMEQPDGDFIALWYTWGIPHAEEDATLRGDPEELLIQLMPWRRDKSPEDIEAALIVLADAGLILWDEPNRLVQYPIDSFYEYQTNIAQDKRRTADMSNNYQSTAENSSEQQRTATKRVSSSLSSSPSFTPNNVRSDKRTSDYSSEFEGFWVVYPRKVDKKGAFAKWKATTRELGPDVVPSLMRAVIRYADECRRKGKEPDFILHAATFLGPKERWRDWLTAPDSNAAPSGTRPAPAEDDVARQLRELEEQEHGEPH